MVAGVPPDSSGKFIPLKSPPTLSPTQSSLWRLRQASPHHSCRGDEHRHESSKTKIALLCSSTFICAKRNSSIINSVDKKTTMASDELNKLGGLTNGAKAPAVATQPLAKIKTVEYFRVKPRWLFVKITDTDGCYGWGEGTLEGHTKAVEGALDEIIDRIVGLEAE